MTVWRRIIGPALMALVMLIVLLGLGDWQVHRLHWKCRILAQIDLAEAAPPVPLPAHPAPFQKVAIAGTLVAGSIILYGADVRDTPQGPQLGAGLIQELTRDAAPPVLVDRGWVPVSPAGVLAAPLPVPAGPVTLTGYIRTPDHPHLFSPHDDAVARRFYTLDPAAMGRALGLPEVAPFTLVLLGADHGATPIPATSLPRPPNDHLSYAITWFSLALVLVVVFVVWARRRLREG